MRFTESRILQLYSDSESGWAEYSWSEQHQRWRHRKASEGYCKRHGLPYEFTEAERTLLEIKLSNE